EGGKALAEGEALGRILGIETRDAAIDQQSAECHDERLDAHLGNEKAMHRAHRDADGDDDEDGEAPGQAEIGDEIYEDDTEKRDDRPHRQLDTAGDDDKRLGKREKAEEADEI